MKRLLFVDDEPRVLQGLERQLYKMRSQWEMSFAESGSQALASMALAPVDVIVSDMMMPGMDGAQLLAEVRDRFPGTVRLVLSGHSDRESVLRLVGPAHQYLSKPCDAEELRSAIARALTLRDLLASDQLKQLASRIRCLPSLPVIYTRLNDEFRKEEPSIQRIAEIVSKDIAMTAKILQLVNSAFFGLPQPAATVEDAVAYLGLSTLRALVLSLQLFSQFNPRLSSVFSMDELSDHSWRTGVMARRIAEAEHSSTAISDQCFLAGLLHHVGCLVLASGLPVQFSQVLQAAHLGSQPMWEIEKTRLGASHAEVGGYLLGLWGLPNPVIEAVALHHQPAASPAAEFSPLIAIHVATVLASGSKPPSPERIDLVHLSALGLSGRLPEWSRRCLGDEPSKPERI